MSYKCAVCGKTNNTARKYRYRGSYVTKRVPRVQRPNLRKMKVIENGIPKRITVCTRCVRSDKVTRRV
ncbi:MAG: 50S ribosomal protein L28 [Endomicrobium sp.]|jgi:large subunit ribosomal protein L28|nr:50S ribosomal protein L28 [Endomicrobium sp.]